MMTTTHAMLDVAAEEIMTRDVLTIPRNMSLRAAAHRLIQAGVSGAPVTDETGRCVGVLSRADLVRFLDQGSPATQSLQGGFWSDWEVPETEGLPSDEVTRYMSTEVISATSNTRLAELARLMHDNHIHRVLITDGWGRVIGIVGSMDVLGVLAAEGAAAPP